MTEGDAKAAGANPASRGSTSDFRPGRVRWVVLGWLAVGAIVSGLSPSYVKGEPTAEDRAHAQVWMLREALDIYRQTHGKPLGSLRALRKWDPQLDLFDPWGREFELATSGRGRLVVRSSGEDRLMHTDDDVVAGD